MSAETVYVEWNPAKALFNARKHDVTFDQAATVFLDALALTVYDEEHSQNEDRWFTLGYDSSGKLLAVAHTYEVTDRQMFECVLSPRGRLRDVNDGPMKTNPDR